MWGVMWYSRNKRDGVSEHLICQECVPVLFATRRLARQWILRNYGYIKLRKDLKAEPHGWRMPVPVKVKVSVPNHGVST